MPRLIRNYLSKCAQNLSGIFFTEDLPNHYKILKSFELYDLLFFFCNEKTCTLRLVFLLLFVKACAKRYFND